MVEFSEEERDEYRVYEEKALDFYANFRRRHLKTLSKHFFKLSAKLTQSRIACAGGYIPLDSNEDAEVDEVEDNSEDEELEPPTKKKAKAVQYSDFAFQSKFRKLIEELEHARDNDPTCKCFFRVVCSTLWYILTASSFSS